MKYVSIVLLTVIAVMCLSCSTSQLKDIEALLPDLAGKNDGIYRGEYDLEGTPVKVALDVTVKSHYVAAVKIIKHTCSPIGKKAEKITGRIIETQSLNVEAISGATGSSKAILKAVENALQ